jgi:hypothetical protein
MRISMRLVFVLVLAAMEFSISAHAQEPTNLKISAPKAWAATRREFVPDVVPFGQMLLPRLTTTNVEERICQGGWHLIVNGDPSVKGFDELKGFFPTLTYGYKGRIEPFLIDTATREGQGLSKGQFNEIRPGRVVVELWKSDPPSTGKTDKATPAKDLVYLSSRDWFKADEITALRARAPQLADECERGDYTLDTLKEWLRLRTGMSWGKPTLTPLNDMSISKVVRSDAMHLVVFYGNPADAASLSPEEKAAQLRDLDELASMTEMEAAIPCVKANVHDSSFGETVYRNLLKSEMVEEWDGKLVVMLFRGHATDTTRVERWVTRKLTPGKGVAQVKTYVAESLSLTSLESQAWVLNNKPALASSSRPAPILTTSVTTPSGTVPPCTDPKEIVSNASVKR